jgi:hypothetical protein
MCTFNISNPNTANPPLTQIIASQALSRNHAPPTCFQLSMFLEVFTKNWKLNSAPIQKIVRRASIGARRIASEAVS